MRNCGTTPSKPVRPSTEKHAMILPEQSGSFGQWCTQPNSYSKLKLLRPPRHKIFGYLTRPATLPVRAMRVLVYLWQAQAPQ